MHCPHLAPRNVTVLLQKLYHAGAAVKLGSNAWVQRSAWKSDLDLSIAANLAGPISVSLIDVLDSLDTRRNLHVCS